MIKQCIFIIWIIIPDEFQEKGGTIILNCGDPKMIQSE
jgi:hypothetical protein